MQQIIHITTQVPVSETEGEWVLRVEGREGKEGGLVFAQAANLTFSPSFLTILIQPSRPVYNAGQKGKTDQQRQYSYITLVCA